jgi:hypothetical protein
MDWNQLDHLGYCQLTTVLVVFDIPVAALAISRGFSQAVRHVSLWMVPGRDDSRHSIRKPWQ